MTLEEMLTRSADLQNEILLLLEDVPTHPGERFETSMAFCEVALEHAQALRILFEHDSPTTAMSALRLQFEALTRAMWVLYAANDLAIQKLTAPLTEESARVANKLPQVGVMIDSIVKKAPAEASSMLVQFKDISWPAMNSYVHSGIHPLRRHLEGYPVQLVLQVLQSSNGLMTMTGMLAAILTGNECCINPMRGIQTKFKDCLPPVIPLAPQV
ncbi:hypothetical protein C4K18_3067 [Pseudomonas chlororaphis subsp. aurantiaca]|nr:hypothetical protein C4K18_3067 [Pseudomonas chlororaphis subsp. aurantiaca]